MPVQTRSMAAKRKQREKYRNPDSKAYVISRQQFNDLKRLVGAFGFQIQPLRQYEKLPVHDINTGRLLKLHRNVYQIFSLTKDKPTTWLYNNHTIPCPSYLPTYFWSEYYHESKTKVMRLWFQIYKVKDDEPEALITDDEFEDMKRSYIHPLLDNPQRWSIPMPPELGVPPYVWNL